MRSSQGIIKMHTLKFLQWNVVSGAIIYLLAPGRAMGVKENITSGISLAEVRTARFLLAFSNEPGHGEVGG
ncbi:hypothetical protein D3C75_818660 [compost metagenome]